MMVLRSNDQWRRGRSSLMALACVLPSACADPKAATKANFIAALKPVVADAPCVQLDGGDIRLGSDPMALPPPLPILRRPADRYGNKERLAELDRYVAAGILDRTEQVVPERQANGQPLPSRVLAYAPTEAGKEIVGLHDVVRNRGHVTVAMLCVGRGEVVAVDSFTAPAEMMGMKMTRVTYRWHRTDISDWARQAIARADPVTAMRLDEERTATAALVLTDAGWVDSKTLGV